MGIEAWRTASRWPADAGGKDDGEPLSGHIAQGAALRTSQIEAYRRRTVVEQYVGTKGQSVKPTMCSAPSRMPAGFDTRKNRCDPRQCLARYSGLCRGEMLMLMKDCYRVLPEADGERKVYGEVTVKRALKRRGRRRKLLVEGRGQTDSRAGHSTVEVRVRVHPPPRPVQETRRLSARGADGTLAQQDPAAC